MNTQTSLTLQGNVTRDLTIRDTDYGPVANFGLITGNEERGTKQYHAVKAWRETALSTAMIEKGDLVRVTGYHKPETFAHPESGQTVERMAFVATELTLVRKSKENAARLGWRTADDR